MPPGARDVADAGGAPMAFASRAAVGLQFHPEVTAEIAEAWIAGAGRQLAAEALEVPQIRERIATGLAGSRERAFCAVRRARRPLARAGARVGSRCGARLGPDRLRCDRLHRSARRRIPFRPGRRGGAYLGRRGPRRKARCARSRAGRRPARRADHRRRRRPRVAADDGRARDDSCSTSWALRALRAPGDRGLHRAGGRLPRSHRRDPVRA